MTVVRTSLSDERFDRPYFTPLVAIHLNDIWCVWFIRMYHEWVRSALRRSWGGTSGKCCGNGIVCMIVDARAPLGSSGSGRVSTRAVNGSLTVLWLDFGRALVFVYESSL